MRAAAGDHLKVMRYLVEERDTELHSAGRSSCITEEMLSIIIWKACDGIQTYGDVGRCTKGEGFTYVHGEHEISGTASHQLLLVEHPSPDQHRRDLERRKQGYHLGNIAAKRRFQCCWNRTEEVCTFVESYITMIQSVLCIGNTCCSLLLCIFKRLCHLVSFYGCFHVCDTVPKDNVRYRAHWLTENMRLTYGCQQWLLVHRWPLVHC